MTNVVLISSLSLEASGFIVLAVIALMSLFNYRKEKMYCLGRISRSNWLEFADKRTGRKMPLSLVDIELKSAKVCLFSSQLSEYNWHNLMRSNYYLAKAS